MKKFLVIFVCFFSGYTGFAEDLTPYYDSIFQHGNELYKAQKYEEAIIQYQKVLESGFEAANLYYNLGNSFYKVNKNTQAILYYEKALKLFPGQPDFKYNLGLAKKNIVDRVENVPIPFYKEWWRNIVFVIPLGQWAQWNIVLFGFFVLTLVLFLTASTERKKRLFFFVSLISFLGFGFSWVAASSQNNLINNTHEAIVFASRTPVYSGPNTTSTQLFVIHSGLKVEVIQTENQWCNIILPDGNKGWIPLETIMEI